MLFGVDFKKKHFYDVCAHFCAPFGQNMCAFVRFLKIFDVRIFVRLLAKICAHLSLELLDTLEDTNIQFSRQNEIKNCEKSADD